MVLSIISLALSVPIGFLINLATPWFRTKFSARSESRRKKRIAQIQYHWQVIEKYRNGAPNRLIALAAVAITVAILLGVLDLSFLVMAGYTYSEETDLQWMASEVALVLAAVITAVLAYGGLSFFRFFEDIYTDGRSYRSRIEKDLRKLNTSISEIIQSTQTQESSDEREQAPTVDNATEESQVSSSSLS